MEKRKINQKKSKSWIREERSTGGKRWKGECHKHHNTDGIPCLSSRVEEQHTAVSQFSQSAPIGCQ